MPGGAVTSKVNRSRRVEVPGITCGPYEMPYHLRIFEAWYVADRQTKVISEQLTVGYKTLCGWVTDFKWHERADKRDLEIQAAYEKLAVNQKIELLKKQTEVGQKLVNLALEYIEREGVNMFTETREVLAALKDGFQLQRQAVGLPDWIGQIMGMTDDQLSDRLQTLQNEVLRIGGATEDEATPGASDGGEEAGIIDGEFSDAELS